MGTPADEIAAYLQTLIPELTGVLLRVGDEEAPPKVGVSALQVRIANTTGFTETALVDGGARSADERAAVNIRVRGDKDDFLTAETLALQIADALDLQAPPPFYDCRLQGSGLLRLGPDADGFPRFSLNFVLSRYVERLEVFWGPRASAPTTEAEVRALASTRRQSRRNGFFTLTTGAGDRAVLVLPTAFGTPDAFSGVVGRTALALSAAGSVDLLDSGRSRPYTVWVSAPQSAGTFSVKVQ